jgi:hypothetical protein
MWRWRRPPQLRWARGELLPPPPQARAAELDGFWCDVRRRGDATCGSVSGACCKCVSHEFQMSHQDVANVLCGCCKSRSRCFNVEDVDPATQRLIPDVANYLFSNVADVATIFNIFLMLQTLILNVADVEFRCCKHVGCCVEGEEGP